MSTSYSISDNFVVTLYGDVELIIPINPETGMKFVSYEEAEAFAIKSSAIITLEKVGSAKIWTPYEFLKKLPEATLGGCIELEKAQDTKMIVFMRMMTVAQNIRSDDINLLSFLDYCISKGILTEEQKSTIIK